MNYKEELTNAMTWLGKQNTIFIGQSIQSGGTFMTQTFKDVSEEQKVEFPVCESLQMQFSLGVALAGQFVVSVYPRLNFLLLALADMVNTIDKIPAISYNKVRPRLIIRSAIGPDSPVHPGHQHIGDYTQPFKLMFNSIKVIRLDNAEDIFDAYQDAYHYDGTTLLIEDGREY